MNTIPAVALERAIRGKNLRGATFGEELARRELSLIVFLRHFG